MNHIVDFFSLIIFFIFYKIYDIYVASAAMIVAAGMSLIIKWILFRKLKKAPLFTFILIAIFSSLTLIFHNDGFIKCKVTIIYLLFSIGLLYSQWFMKKTLIQSLLCKELKLSEIIYRRLNFAWAMFFLICSITNFYIAFWFPQKYWINFKVFWLTGITFLFTLLSGLYIWQQELRKQK